MLLERSLIFEFTAADGCSSFCRWFVQCGHGTLRVTDSQQVHVTFPRDRMETILMVAYDHGGRALDLPRSRR